MVHTLGGRGERIKSSGLRSSEVETNLGCVSPQKKGGWGLAICEMAQWVKVSAVEPDNLSIPGPIWWKAGIHPLTSKCVPTHINTPPPKYM